MNDYNEVARWIIMELVIASEFRWSVVIFQSVVVNYNNPSNKDI